MSALTNVTRIINDDSEEPCTREEAEAALLDEILSEIGDGHFGRVVDDNDQDCTIEITVRIKRGRHHPRGLTAASIALVVRLIGDAWTEEDATVGGPIWRRRA